VDIPPFFAKASAGNKELIGAAKIGAIIQSSRIKANILI
jgi:hypothetical protein